MTSLPAPLRRGFAVFEVGAALAMGHIAFASAAPKATQVASAAAPRMDAGTTGSVSGGRGPGEIGSVETVLDRTAAGKTVTRRVHACD